LIKFSIITVVKNNNLEIEKTINSLHSQNFKNFEHIIIDGNSSDGTSKIIKKKINLRIKYYRAKDRGIYDAINKGIKLSKGEYIGLLHGGDFFASNKILFNVNNYLKKNDVVTGNICFYNKNLNILRFWRKPLSILSAYNAFKVPHTAMFIKKNIFEKMGNYNINYKISSDTDFIIRLSKYNCKLFYLDKTIIFMKSGGLSFSFKNFFIKLQEDLNIYYKYFYFLFVVMYLIKILSKISDFYLFNNYKLIKSLNYRLKREYKKIID
jgi:glycosyltransferase involved in cell wall biosynthesis